jgi:S-adenosylmethionine:tRNA ribosyltransferase-isomerase
MKLSDFDYNFPKELIALVPVERRDSSRLLVIDRVFGRIEHRVFTDLPFYLKKGDVVVINDTKVVPAALKATLDLRISGSAVDILVLERLDNKIARCLVKPSKKFKLGTKIAFDGNGISAEVIERYPSTVLRFSCLIDDLLEKKGRMPLPPYIKREPQKRDFETYQTVYAKNPGAVAAPTAGLHFTKDVLRKIAKKGANTANITLHVGYGTFRPVRCENVVGHNMHKEWFSVPRETIAALNQVRKNNSRILAVGTTSCRVLETIGQQHVWETGKLGNWETKKLDGYTDIFIYPPYEFKLTDMLLTNFHLPKTTLLMLVSAFCGRDLMMKAYREAIERRYRLFSYGDAMLII